MYIRRNLGFTLKQAMKQFPAMFVTGPRQPSRDAALSGPMGGALLEGLIVMETVKAIATNLKWENGTLVCLVEHETRLLAMAGIPAMAERHI